MNEKNTKEETFESIANAAGLDDGLSAEPEEKSQEEAKATEDPVIESEEIEIPKTTTPWIDLAKVDFKNDFKSMHRNPLWIIVSILALLLLALFVAMFIQLKEEEDHKALVGYVGINHKLPVGYKNKNLPADIKEILEIYHEKVKKEAEKFQIDKEDPHDHEPLLNDKYPNPISNAELIKILKAQKIGSVTDFGAEKTELANLSGLNLTKINYRYINNFVSSNLQYCDLSGINYSGLIFRAASLKYAQFVDATIEESNFMRARLHYSNFYLAKANKSFFQSAIAIEAHMAGAELKHCNFDESVFKLSDFANAVLEGSSAKHAFFEGVNFEGANLIGVNFKAAILRGASFVGADLRAANFQDASLEGANFEGANIDLANFANADIAEANFKNVINATYKQLNASQFMISAKNIPKNILPKKYGWQETYSPPRSADQG